MFTLRLLGYPTMASIFIDCSKASVKEAIHCCVNGIHVRGSNPWMYHSLWWSSWIGCASLPMESLNFWLYSQVDSPSLFWILHNSDRACCSDRGNWNSVMNFIRTWPSVNACPCIPLISIAFMYHLRALPIKVLWNSTNLFASRVPLDLKIASHRNQWCSTSSSPLPQNLGI